MKRFLALLAAFLLLTSTTCALELPYPADTILSVRGLTETQQALCEMLYEPLFACRETIALPDGTLYEDVRTALSALTQDYPELFHVGKSFSFHYYQDEPEYVTSIEPVYILSADEAANLRAQLYVQAGLMVATDPDPESLHDRLCSMVTYGGDENLRHTAVGALLQGQATCEGYAQALTLLYRMAGVPCGMVIGTAADETGTTSGHSWNIADLDGYCFIDATWNDQDALGVNTHWYYGLSTGQMGVDHWPDAVQVIPLCSSEANWHDRHGYMISDADAADAALRRLVAGEVLNLRVTDGMLYAALAHDTHAWLDGYNERNPEAAFYGAYSVICSDAQQCVMIQRVE